MDNRNFTHDFAAMYRVLLVCAALMTRGCDEQPTQLLPQSGTIQGRVVNEYGNPPSSALVELKGTPFSAITDSSGWYTIYHVPEGEYEVYVEVIEYTREIYFYKPQTKSVTVNAGVFSVIPDIILIENIPTDTSNSSYAMIYDLHVMSCTHLGNTPLLPHQQYPFPPYLVDERTPLLYCTNTDCIQLEFVTGDMRFSSSAHLSSREYIEFTPCVVPTTVTHNRDTVYSAMPVKGRVLTPEIHRTGADTIRMQVDDETKMILVFYDSLARNLHDTVSYLTIVTGKISWRKSSFRSDVNFVKDNDTLTFVHDRVQKIDWDLYLVNLQTMDTCWWKNNHPNWHHPDSNANRWETSLTGDYSTRRSQEETDLDYSTEKIISKNLPDGDYDIHVHFFNGPPDSIESTPQVHIFMGRIRFNGRIISYHSNTPDQPMKKGETWYAGRIRFPELLFEPGQ